MASRTVLHVCALFGAAVLWACYSTNEAADGSGGSGGVTSANAGPQGGVGTSTTVPGSDLSCELATFFAQRCQECHGAKPVQGATISLLGRADLVAPLPEDSSRTVADEVLARMKDDSAPMPPSPKPRASSAEIALVQDWISAGKPVQSCGAADVPPPPPPADDPFATSTVCTSKTTWSKGDQGSDDMHPGRACLSCHKFPDKAFFKAPFDIAGTIYPSGHEPDDCYGAAGVTVVITDANGKEYRIDTNSAGNFFHSSTYGLQPIAMPYRAKIVRGTVERVMKDAQSNGDCNHCHTEKGTEKAPGRIMAP